MKPVTGFDRCKETESGKLVWNSNDPEFGVNVPIWKQTSYDIDCTNEEDCDSYCSSYNALFVGGIKGRKCYSYEVLEYVCFTIDYDNILSEYKYSGGCLKNNEHYIMRQAERDKVYRFEDVFIEVRYKKDPVIYAGEISNYTYSFGSSFSLFASFLNLLIIGCLFILAFVAFTIFNHRKRQSLIGDAQEKKENISQDI
jgi:hypothetical protein